MSRPVDPRLLRCAPAGRHLIVTLAGLQTVGGVLVVAQAVLVASVVVTIFGGHADVRSVLVRLALLAAVGLARAVVAGRQETVTVRASLTIRAQVRRAALESVVALGPAWAKRQPPGRVVTITGPGLDALDGYVTRAVPALVSAAVIPVLALVAIIVMDWQSGLILLVLVPLVPVFMVLIGITTGRLVERQYLALGQLAGQFLDLVRGLTTLRIYGQAGAQERTLAAATQAYRRQTVAALRVALLSGLVLDLLAALSVAIVAVDIGLRLAAGDVSFMTALLVLLLAPEVFAPLRAVGAQHHATQEGGTAAAAALDLIDEAARSTGTVDGPPDGMRPTGGVVLDSLSVVYPGRTVAALHGLSLTLEPGQVVALTGASGAGKSTILAALLGYLAPTDGRILIDAENGSTILGSTNAEAWRASLAWLPQRPRPSRPSVGEEIRLGDPDATPDEVAEVASLCRTLDESVMLGEDGRGVSAGERRRIALARVLLRARAVRQRGGIPLVLLDEPSEDLDQHTERVVVEVICSLAGWATVVVAGHSPVLAALADVRVELIDGCLVDVVRQTAVRGADGPLPARAEAPARSSATRMDTGCVFRLRDLVRAAGATGRLARAVTLSGAAALSALGLTTCGLWLISRAAQHPNVQALALAVVGVRAFALTRSLLRYCERLATHDAALLMLAELRVRVFAALRPLSPTVLGDYGRGDLLRRFVGDVDGAQEGLVRALVPSAGAVAGAFGAVVIAGFLDPAAAIVLAAGLLIAGVGVPVLGFRLAGNVGPLVALAGRREQLSAGLVDSLDEVVAFGATGLTLDAIAELDAQLEVEARPSVRLSGLTTMIGGTVAALTMSLVLAFAARATSTGGVSVVAVAVLVGCVLCGFEAISTLPAAFVAWARCRAGLQRVSGVLDQDPALSEPPRPLPIPSGPLGLRAVDIDLAPSAGAAHVLSGAGFELVPGRRIAIVGPSGCGKSTLLAAALRMTVVDTGTLAVTESGHAIDLRDLGAQDVPQAVAGSLQGDHVFDATLRDNLRFVRPTATEVDLDAIASRVGLSAMIQALPDGWSTPAGPDGAALSGGQRQRLLIARALLADPSILIFDEPTAHLDARTEQVVLAEILSATDGRTVLMTTHRRLHDGQVDATLRIADRTLRHEASDTAARAGAELLKT